MIKKFKYFFPALIWLFAILILSSYPGNKIPSAPFFGFDKVVHITIYFLLSLFVMFGFYFIRNKENLTLKLMIICAVFGILFGGLMEICQHYIFVNRSGNCYDFLANTIGAIIGVAVCPKLFKLLPFKR
ncbi:VanZ family protein [Vicingus serpentipes]|uniref:VanZ family protein n=1 Tax=Vicingus serpentipes TaxID=1926625 RepID=UPI00147698A9